MHSGGEKGISHRVQNIEGLIWKDLRATFGTRLAEAGCDAFTIAQLLGHSDVRVTMRTCVRLKLVSEWQLRQCD